MSIKTTIKEHFSNNHIKGHFVSSSLKVHWDDNSLKNYWGYLTPDNMVNEGIKQFYGDSDLDFRRFSWEDLDGCAELFKNVFSEDPWYDDWKSVNQAKNYLSELASNPVFEGFIVQENSKIVAVCMGRTKSWWRGKEFVVDEFFVANERQGNGIGTKLMDFVTENLSEEAYSRLVLLTNKEIPAETFYLKKGFYNNLKRTVMVKEL